MFKPIGQLRNLMTAQKSINYDIMRQAKQKIFSCNQINSINQVDLNPNFVRMFKWKHQICSCRDDYKIKSGTRSSAGAGIITLSDIWGPFH